LAADPAADTRADKDWKAYHAVEIEGPGRAWDKMSALQQRQWIEAHWLRVRELGLAFIDNYPTDPRRYSIILNFTPKNPRFVKDWGRLDDDGNPTSPFCDASAAAAWRARVAQLKSTLANAKDLPPDVREEIAYRGLDQLYSAASAAEDKGQLFDLSGFRAKLLEFGSQYPYSERGGDLFGSFAWLVEKQGVAKLEEEASAFLKSPNDKIAEGAKAKFAFCQLAKAPLDIAFTAIDGRAVDLKELRGKVVLLDFWATWCGPCLAEIPNVKKAYDEFHEKGFEVVGISLDEAQVDSRDTPEQAAAKIEKAKKALTQFIAKTSIPWPQYFDGKGWDSEMPKKYALSAIPAMFLVDQEGRIVTTRADGEDLQKGIRRLLKL
jgi:thiol-disulfide isomerase/thioredoxin